MVATAEPIILASASAARAMLLRAAAIDFSVEPATIDEAQLKRAARKISDSALGCASALATAKACFVSRRHPEALVIGADQILAAGMEWFDKPGNLAEACAQLQVCAAERIHLRPPCALHAAGSNFGARRACRN
jgi:septum formation protein